MERIASANRDSICPVSLDVATAWQAKLQEAIEQGEEDCCAMCNLAVEVIERGEA